MSASLVRAGYPCGHVLVLLQLLLQLSSPPTPLFRTLLQHPVYVRASKCTLNTHAHTCCIAALAAFGTPFEALQLWAFCSAMDISHESMKYFFAWCNLALFNKLLQCGGGRLLSRFRFLSLMLAVTRIVHWNARGLADHAHT